MKHQKPLIQLIARIGLAALLLGIAVSLAAHEAKLNTVPEDGATVQGSPESIGVEFDGQMRITQFEVTGPDGQIELADGPGSDPTREYVVKPAAALKAGRYQVSWRGLARDGHMMSGSFSFTVED
jgi:copper resistance protein C